MKRVRTLHAPHSMRRHHIPGDRPVLAPASLLPFRDEWRRLGDGLPRLDALFVVPNDGTPLCAIMKRVARDLHARLSDLRPGRQAIYRKKQFL